MSCFQGCFGWAQGGSPVPEVPTAGQALPQLLTRAEAPPRPRNERKISKGSNGTTGSRDSRVHYSLTGMQLPDSPVRSKKVTYSITGMPLYENEETRNASQTVAGRRGSGSKETTGTSGTNESKASTSSKGSKGSNGRRMQYSITGMPLPESPQRKTHAITGMPLHPNSNAESAPRKGLRGMFSSVNK